MVPDVLVERWQAAYRAYNAAGGDRAELARLSAAVAVAWRDIAAVPGLAWWLVAALSSAAEAFERQAQDWGRGGRCGVSGRPTERRNGSRHGGEPSGDWMGSRVSGSVK
jgi:hypothetical protein